MGQQLYKPTSYDVFGNGRLIVFLEEHGAEILERSAIDVPAAAFRAALAAADELGLSPKDIAIIEREIGDADDDESIDIYDIA